MKKSKLLIIGIISLISIAIINESYLQYEKKDMLKKEKLKEEEAQKAKEKADSLKNVIANTFTDEDSLQAYSKYLTNELKIKTTMSSDGRINMKDYIFHIDDIEIYYNSLQRLTYIVCKNHEREAFYHEESNASTDTDKYMINFNNSDRGCIEDKSNSNMTVYDKFYSMEYEINKTQLDYLISELNWFKKKYGLIGNKNFVIKNVPKKYIDSEGFFIAHKNTTETKPIIDNNSNRNNPRLDQSKRGFVSGFDPSPSQ